MTLNKPLITFVTVTLLSLLSAGQVMAQQATPDYARAQVVTSTASRADVQADYTAFRATGEPGLASTELGNRSQTVAVSVPRAVVKAETLRALKNHEVVSQGEIFYIRAPNAAHSTQSGATSR